MATVSPLSCFWSAMGLAADPSGFMDQLLAFDHPALCITQLSECNVPSHMNHEQKFETQLITDGKNLILLIPGIGIWIDISQISNPKLSTHNTVLIISRILSPYPHQRGGHQKVNMSPNLAHIPKWCSTKAHKIYVHKLRIMSEVQLWTIWSFGEWTWDVPGGC